MSCVSTSKPPRTSTSTVRPAKATSRDQDHCNCPFGVHGRGLRGPDSAAIDRTHCPSGINAISNTGTGRNGRAVSPGRPER